jgi:CHAT domain-containing protein
MRGPTAAYRRSALALSLVLLSFACARRDSPEQQYQRSWALFVSGNLPKTIQAVAAESARWKDRANSVWYWRFHLLHAEALLSQGKVKEAAALLQSDTPANSGLSEMALRRQVDQANVLLQSDRQKALAMLDAAAPHIADPDTQIRIHLLRGAGWLRTTDVDSAEAEFSAALKQAATAGSAYREAGALNNLSLCKRRRGKYEDAIGLATQAVARAGSAHASLVEAQAHNNLANYYLYLGNIADASQHLQQAVNLFESIDARADLMIGSNLLGILNDAREDAPAAIQSYQRAYHIAVELDRKADAALYAANVSIALIKQQKWDEAAAWNQKAADLDVHIDGKPNSSYIARNQARISAARGDAAGAAEACRTLLADSQKNQFLRWEAYELLGSLDARAGRFAKANEEFGSALAVIDGARSQLENPQNRITLLSRLIPFYQEYVESLVEQGNDAGALTVIESSRARVLSESLRRDTKPMAFDAAGLKRLAATTNSSVVSFWLAPKRSFAWLITGREVRRFALPPAAELESLIAAYRNNVEHSWGDPLAAHDPNGAKLWTVLLADMAPHIPRGGSVIVIPDGVLHRLNLETLPVPGPNPHYWVEDVQLAVAPSMTLVAAKVRPRGASAPSLLLVGAPVPVAHFDRLPQADAEIAAIRDRFPRAQQAVLTGPAATVAGYDKSGPGKYSFIHFAAHAEPNPETPLESAIVLSPDQGQYRLRARDIVGSDLNAELVTISACRSAGARVYAGEGLIGLAWAFLEAGSNAVIAGLWDVNDGSSRLLMDQLYAGLAAGQTPAVALHRAKLAMIHADPRYRKPYFWAPFQAYVRSAM